MDFLQTLGGRERVGNLGAHPPKPRAGHPAPDSATPILGSNPVISPRYAHAEDQD